MSMVFNMVGGGKALSATDAICGVKIATGATVTMTKDNRLLKPVIVVTYVDNSSYDYALFSIPSFLLDSQFSWTITEVLGSQQTTYTMMIGSVKEYCPN